MPAYAIQARELAKSYKIPAQPGKRYKTLQEDVVSALRRPLARRPSASETFWALDDITFDVRAGEALGIIGRNGAGKSTLLKILARITRPTRGTADVYGRMGSLLEVGTGFHPELTGRENVYLNGAILGMTRSDIRRRFDEIVAFADVESFLDVPVKRYSSGMYMRLAFAVAAHLEPEILVVDEVLAVGDVAFQAKSLGKMGEVARSGRTVLFVSHNLAAVTQLCQTGMLLDHGRVVGYGTAADVVSQHLASGNRDGQVVLEGDRAGASPAHFVSAELLDGAGNVCQNFPIGSDIAVRFALELASETTTTKLAVSIRADDGLPIAHIVDDDGYFALPSGRMRRSITVSIPDIRLYPGAYHVSLWAMDPSNAKVYDHAEDCLVFYITDGGRLTFRRLPRDNGLFFLSSDWRLEL